MNSFQSSGGAPSRLTGKVKWFNRSKGFGFVVPDDGSSDVFLPMAVLERAGFAEAPDGASISFEWTQGPKGRSISQIFDLDTSALPPRAPREGGGPAGRERFGGGARERDSRERDSRERERAPREAASGPTIALDGIVKWYDPARGFGFVLPNDGGKDVFVHVSALQRAGLDMLEPNQPVRMMVQQAKRGREAQSIELL
ncbi:MAG TPA: cold shock domain-containing protein [Stellaceae bacterium]|nr:cold shock domain-containing protein [Stellaceae bacterium]